MSYLKRARSRFYSAVNSATRQAEKAAKKSSKKAGGFSDLLKKNLKKKTKKITSSLKKNAGSLSKSVKKRAGDLSGRAKRSSKDLFKSAKKQGSAFAGKVKKQGKKMSKRLDKKMDDAIAKFKNLPIQKTMKKTRKQLAALGEACMEKPKKCAAMGAGVALAGYTAYTMYDNSNEQRECISKCLPPNWMEVVNNDESPEYFDKDEIRIDDDVVQPQCSASIGMENCEEYCQSFCEAEHPTTVIGAAMEATGSVIDDAIVPFAEDVLGLPITAMGNAVRNAIRVATVLVGAIVAYKVYKLVRALAVGERGQTRVMYMPPPQA